MKKFKKVMKSKMPLCLYWLKPTKLKILFSIILFLLLIFSVISTCAIFKSFNYCLINFIRKYYIVVFGFILISYFTISWLLEFSGH